jgi:hypothetical protein
MLAVTIEKRRPVPPPKSGPDAALTLLGPGGAFSQEKVKAISDLCVLVSLY